MTVTADDLRAASWDMAMHLNMGAQGHQYAYTSATFPEATIQKGWTKERRKDAKPKSYAVMKIRMGEAYVETPLADLDECARLITKARQLKADDQAWDVADPLKAGAA